MMCWARAVDKGPGGEAEAEGQLAQLGLPAQLHEGLHITVGASPLDAVPGGGGKA